MAAAVLARHRPGALTLVVMNTVDAAQRLYRQLRGGRRRTARCCTPDFAALNEPSGWPPPSASPADAAGGRIVSATQVVEAGLDLDAAVLVTEAAPWPSLIQRAGLCNRSGLLNADAEVWWLPPPDPFPYQQEDIDATARELGRLEGERLTTEDLAARDVPHSRGQVTVIRRADLDGLFDTSPDPSGNDVDIARYVRDAEDLDVEVAWATWTPGDDGAPDPEVRVPAAEYRCRVPIGAVVALARGRAVWRYDRSAGGWTRVTQPPGSRPRPGEVLLVSAADGGYDPETGFDPAAPGPVPDSPELLTPEEWRALALAAPRRRCAAAEWPRRRARSGRADGRPTRPSPAAGSRSTSTASRSATRPRRCSPSSPRASRPRPPAAPSSPATCTTSARRTRSGRTRSAPLPMRRRGPTIEAGRPWAKSGGNGPLLFADGVAFRHELASLLLIDGPLAGLLAESPDPALTKYLVLAHHGKLRLQVREHHASAAPPVPRPSRSCPPRRSQRPAAPARRPAGSHRHPRPPPGRDVRHPGHARPARHHPHRRPGPVPARRRHSWTQTVHGLLDRYGPFVLAYLEALVRISDWRASGGRELPTA